MSVSNARQSARRAKAGHWSLAQVRRRTIPWQRSRYCFGMRRSTPDRERRPFAQVELTRPSAPAPESRVVCIVTQCYFRVFKKSSKGVYWERREF